MNTPTLKQVKDWLNKVETTKAPPAGHEFYGNQYGGGGAGSGDSGGGGGEGGSVIEKPPTLSNPAKGRAAVGPKGEVTGPSEGHREAMSYVNRQQTLIKRQAKKDPKGASTSLRSLAKIERDWGYDDLANDHEQQAKYYNAQS